QIDVALERCTEFPYPVRLPHIRQRIPGLEIPDPEAQARAAWDRAQTFAKRHVYSSPVDGNGVCIDDCRAEKCRNNPRHYLDEHLPQQIRDTVRRCGGWRPIALSLREPDPFLKKEFMSEFQSWRAVERASSRLALPGDIAARFKQLVEAKDIQ